MEGTPLLTPLPTTQAWVSSGPTSEDCLGHQPLGRRGPPRWSVAMPLFRSVLDLFLPSWLGSKQLPPSRPMLALGPSPGR